MRKFLLIVTILFSLISNGQTPLHKLIRKKVSSPFVPDTFRVNFSLTARAVTGYTNIFGEPDNGTLSSSIGGGITLSSGSTGNWTPEGTVTAAQNAGSSFSGSLFGANCGLDYIFNKKSAAPGSTASAHWTFSGLTPGSYYTLTLLGSRTAADARSMNYHVFDNAGGHTSSAYVVQNNATLYITFTNMIADGSGNIYLSAYGNSATASSVYGYYNALMISTQNGAI